MSDAPGRREVAHRVFAAEYDDATHEYSESDEDLAPNYVVTPAGARVNRLFAVGVLTEVEAVSDDVLRARIADPTGAFVVYAGQYQPEAAAFLESAEPPAFVALTGKARTFSPDDSDRVFTSVRPERINAVDADTRDRWIVDAAESTLVRTATFAAALELDVTGDRLRSALEDSGVDPSLAAGIAVARDHYGTTEHYLAGLAGVARDALRLVAGEIDEVEVPTVGPADSGDGVVDYQRIAEAVPRAVVDLQESSDQPASSDLDADTELAASEEDESTIEDEPTDQTEPTAKDESAIEDEPTTEDEPTGEDDPGLGEFGSGSTDDSDEVGDFEAGGGLDAEPDDELPEDAEDVLGEEERARLEEEYGAEFTTGTEVDGPGEAGIEPEAGEVDSAESSVDPTDEQATSGETSAEPDEESGEGDLDAALLEAMDELDDGNGADREALVDAVAAEQGVEAGDVDEAIQDALLSGKCFEPADGKLKTI